MSSIYFSSNHRSTNSREKARLTNGLPSYSAAIQEKLYRHGRSSSWLVPLSTPIPGIRNRRLRLWVPNPARVHQVSVARFGRKRGTLLLCFGVFLFVFVTFAVHRRFNSSSKQWPTFPPAILRPSFSPEPIYSGYGSGRLKVGIIRAVRKVRPCFFRLPLLESNSVALGFLVFLSLALLGLQFQKRSVSRQWSRIQLFRHGKPPDCHQGCSLSQSRSRARTASVPEECISTFNHQSPENPTHPVPSPEASRIWIL
jgi:hypothetical protein